MLSTSPSCDDVGLALEPLRAALRRLGVGAGIEQVVPADHLAADEAARDVRVDRAAGLERGLAVAQRPGSRLLLAGGEERDQAEGVLEPPHDLVERRRAVAERGRLLVGELGQLRLELAVDPGGPVDDRDQRLRRQRVELGRAARAAIRSAASRPRGARGRPGAPPPPCARQDHPTWPASRIRSSRFAT